MSKNAWDNRFHIIESRDNHKVHEFYRQFFDKSSRERQERISLPSNPNKFTPNLSSTLEKFSHRIPKLSKLGVKRKKTLESNWDSSFHVKTSKDNQNFYSTYREYFDTPKVFDHNVSVVSTTVPVTVHGFKRTEDRRYSSVDSRTNWGQVYLPISENNIVKYKALRNYFDSFKKDKYS